MVTDCWKGYAGLSEICEQHHVNHQVEFVSEEGYHTNNVEGTYSIVKDWVKKQHRNFGINSTHCQERVALQCVKLGRTHRHGQAARGIRLANIIACVAQYGEGDPPTFGGSGPHGPPRGRVGQWGRA